MTRPAWRAALLNRRMLACVFSGFSSGLPLYLLLNMLPGLALTLAIAEPTVPGGAPRTLRQAVVEPFREFLARSGWRSALLVLGFIALYKLGDSLCTALATPFYLDMGRPPLLHLLRPTPPASGPADPPTSPSILPPGPRPSPRRARRARWESPSAARISPTGWRSCTAWPRTRPPAPRSPPRRRIREVLPAP
jgi:hypothetical protein